MSCCCKVIQSYPLKQLLHPDSPPLHFPSLAIHLSINPSIHHSIYLPVFRGLWRWSRERERGVEWEWWDHVLQQCSGFWNLQGASGWWHLQVLQQWRVAGLHFRKIHWGPQSHHFEAPIQSARFVSIHYTLTHNIFTHAWFSTFPSNILQYMIFFDIVLIEQ